MGEAKVLPQYIAGTSAAFGSFALGSVIGWSAQAQESIQTGEAYGFEVGDVAFSWIGSLLTLGASAMCIPTGFLLNAFGRKMTMLLLVIPFMIGWILLIFAVNVEMMCVARFILGAAGGAFCITVPVYTTEIAIVRLRGVLGTFFQLLITGGCAYGFMMGAILDVHQLNIACAVLPLVFLLFFMWMPESPVYLVKKDKPGVEKSLQWLRGKDYDIKAEIDEIVAADKRSKETTVALGEAMCRSSTLKSLGMSISLMLLQQLTGINAVIFYSTSIFIEAKAGFTPELVTVILGLIMIVSTFLATLTIDKFGRRPLLLLSIAFEGITTLGLGMYFVMKDSDEESVKTLFWLPVASVLLFVIMFSVGLGPIPWLIMAEVFAPDVKDIASSIAGTINWFCAFIVTNSFLILRDLIGTGPCFFMFTLVALFGVFFIFFFIPETKGKTFEQIQKEIQGVMVTEF